jgi:carbon monoxide dehydrogenase subunit G
VIEIENEFSVPADPAAVYRFLLDLERVGGCIPGGRVGAPDPNGAHPAEVAVKLGPMRFTYRGTVRLEDRVEPEQRAMLIADVRETRGQGSAKARMEMTVAGENGGSRVATRTELQMTGRAASMGRGLIDDVAARMVADMAACVTERLGAGEAAGALPVAPQRPVGGLSLALRALWGRLTKLFSRR